MKNVKEENVVTQIKYSIGKSVEEIKLSLEYINRLNNDNLLREKINLDRQICAYMDYLNKSLYIIWFGGKEYSYTEVYFIINQMKKDTASFDSDSWRELSFSKTLFKKVETHNKDELKLIEDRLNKLLWIFINYEYCNDEVILDISDLELIKFYKRENLEDYYAEQSSKAVLVGSIISWGGKLSPATQIGSELSWDQVVKAKK